VDQIGSIRPHALKPCFSPQLFLLHAGQSGVINGQYADVGVVHFAVQMFVVLVEPAKFSVGFHQCFDIITLLVFKHDPTSGKVDGQMLWSRTSAEASIECPHHLSRRDKSWACMAIRLTDLRRTPTLRNRAWELERTLSTMAVQVMGHRVKDPRKNDVVTPPEMVKGGGRWLTRERSRASQSQH
jgi:hypothetical protein